LEVGSAVEELDVPIDDIPVQGRDLITGKPKEIMVNYKEIAKALDKSIIRIEDAVMETLSLTPPELAADIYKTGIYLAGGGALLRGLADRLHRKTGLPVLLQKTR
jgi:rod shape-determining protein MreB